MVEQEKKSFWIIDPVHTKIRFETKYLMITNVSGWFTQFEGTVTTPCGNFDNSQIKLVIYTNSLYTGNEERDNHLRSVDFFDTKNFPSLSFTSKSIQVKGSKVDVVGELCVKNFKETIHFEANYLGVVHDQYGNKKAAFEMSMILNRKNFGISWNKFFDKAGVLLSDEVKLFCDVQLLHLTETA